MRLRFWMGSLVAALLLAVGVQGVAQATSRPVVGGSLEYTGAEYFDGIYFGVGPVAELVPQLQAPGAAGADAALAADLRAHIEAESPRFLATFAAAMVSGDEVVIREALIDGVDRVAAAHQAMFADAAGEGAITQDLPFMVNWILMWEQKVVIAVYVSHEEMAGGGSALHLDEAAGIIATEMAIR